MDLVPIGIGLLLGIYLSVTTYILYEDRPRGIEILIYVFWPITIPISPITRYITKRQRYFRASNGGWYDKKYRKQVEERIAREAKGEPRSFKRNGS
jgi:hypothetical protein